ncbi:MAG: DNA-binding response regulator [Ignavibacteriales bacterium]|nr:MAG: DNA-binding response regulator [Ignavibacteriales bacterium]
MKTIPKVILDVWIIEDDELFREKLSELISLSDEFVCSNIFPACEPAINLLKSEDPPDIFLMDLGLPGMNGIEGIRQIKQIVPGVTMVVLTVFEDTDSILQAISSGASGYLLKDSSLDSIINSLKAILSGGAPINPQIAKKILQLFAKTHLENTYDLTPREREVLSLLVDGLPKKQIAVKMAITFHTVDKHLRNIYTKLQVPSRSMAVAKALKEKLF